MYNEALHQDTLMDRMNRRADFFTDMELEKCRVK